MDHQLELQSQDCIFQNHKGELTIDDVCQVPKHSPSGMELVPVQPENDCDNKLGKC